MNSEEEDEDWPYCEGCYWCEGKGEPEKKPGPLPEGHVITMLEIDSRYGGHRTNVKIFGSYEAAWNHIKGEFEDDISIGGFWQKNRFYQTAAEYEKGEKAMPEPTMRWACAQFNPCSLEYNIYLAIGAKKYIRIWNAYDAVEQCVPYKLILELQKIVS